MWLMQLTSTCACACACVCVCVCVASDTQVAQRATCACEAIKSTVEVRFYERQVKKVRTGRSRYICAHTHSHTQTQYKYIYMHELYLSRERCCWGRLPIAAKYIGTLQARGSSCWWANSDARYLPVEPNGRTDGRAMFARTASSVARHKHVEFYKFTMPNKSVICN